VTLVFFCRKHTREGVVTERVVKKDVVTILGEISMSSCSSESEGGSYNDIEESEEEEEVAETVESEGEEEEEEVKEESSGQEREVGRKA